MRTIQKVEVCGGGFKYVVCDDNDISKNPCYYDTEPEAEIDGDF